MPGEEPEETAGEGVPRPRGIDHVRQQHRWRKEHDVGTEQQRPVFSPLDDEVARPHLEDLPRRPEDGPFAGQHESLFVVDEEDVHALQHIA